MHILALSLLGWLTSFQLWSQDTPWHLVDRKCQSEWSPVVRSSDVLDILGQCEGTEPRVLNLAVTNRAATDAGRLRTFSLGFCGEILTVVKGRYQCETAEGARGASRSYLENKSPISNL